VTTYYRDPDVLITSTRLRIGDRDHRLGDLEQVWHRRGPRTLRAAAGRGALGLVMLIPVAVGLVGIAVALLIHASTVTTLALIGGGVLGGLGVAPLADVLLERVDRSYDRGSRNLEIWGRVRGREVLLLRSDHAQRFGQIYRALQRALESGPVRR
jgi:uncharacterized protein DUF6232